MPAATAFSKQTGQRAVRPDYAIAHAVGWDAGNRAMRAAGRRIWTADDWDAACDAFDRVMRVADAEATQRLAAAAAPARWTQKRRAQRAA